MIRLAQPPSYADCGCASLQVGVAESHKLMSETIESIEFSPNVLDSKVTGKKKKGGQFLTAETILCNVKCQSGASYAIRR